MGLNKSVARLVVLAQTASDGGKSSWAEEYDQVLSSIEGGTRLARSAQSVFYRGYSVKDAFVLQAIEAIAHNKRSGFTFHVTRKSFIDSRGMWNESFIVYFNFKIDDEHYQISFHSFNEKLWKYLGGPCSTRWKKSRDSRESAVALAKHISQ